MRHVMILIVWGQLGGMLRSDIVIFLNAYIATKITSFQTDWIHVLRHVHIVILGSCRDRILVLLGVLHIYLTAFYNMSVKLILIQGWLLALFLLIFLRSWYFIKFFVLFVLLPLSLLPLFHNLRFKVCGNIQLDIIIFVFLCILN